VVPGTMAAAEAVQYYSTNDPESGDVYYIAVKTKVCACVLRCDVFARLLRSVWELPLLSSHRRLFGNSQRMALLWHTLCQRYARW
jgi:hypothetical protein